MLGALAQLPYANREIAASSQSLLLAMTKLIYVRLLDEGTSVYRPIPAQQISEKIFAIGGEDLYDPQTETWEFLPGLLVLAENRILSDGEYLIAVTQAKP